MFGIIMSSYICHICMYHITHLYALAEVYALAEAACLDFFLTKLACT